MFSREDVSAKLDEHIQQLLDKPVLTPEDYSILQKKLAEYPVSGRNDWMWTTLLMMLFSNFGKSGSEK